MTSRLFRDLDLDGETFRQLDLDHPEVEARILNEMSSGVKVYYDRHWPFTREFCRFLLRRPDLVAGRNVLVVGSGVGMEAVVAGRLAAALWINDRAPAALELQQLQLDENGLTPRGVLPGSFGELPLPEEVDLVMACFVVYDLDTAEAMRRLITRSHPGGVPILLADLDIGGHFSRILSEREAPVRRLVHPGKKEGSFSMQVAQVG